MHGRQVFYSWVYTSVDLLLHIHTYARTHTCTDRHTHTLFWNNSKLIKKQKTNQTWSMITIMGYCMPTILLSLLRLYWLCYTRLHRQASFFPHLWVSWHSQNMPCTMPTELGRQLPRCGCGRTAGCKLQGTHTGSQLHSKVHQFSLSSWIHVGFKGGKPLFYLKPPTVWLLVTILSSQIKSSKIWHHRS